jgi:putative transposase
MIELATHQIRIRGVTDHRVGDADGPDLLMDSDAHVDGIKFLLRDRDTKFTAAFDAVFTGAGIRTLRSPVRAPRASAIGEPWIGSCRRGLLKQTLVWNQHHLLTALTSE